jgi:hypothetical protein
MANMKKEKLILNDGMTDTQWLTELYCKDWLSRTGRYVQTTFDPVSTHALYGVYSSEREAWKSRLKNNKGITRIRMIYANSKAFTIICFKYNSQKDQIRYPQLKKE